MKKIYFDITHAAHINLFKNVINILISDGYKVKVFYLDRGKIKDILPKEINSCEIVKVLSWSSNRYYIIFISNILRIFKFLFLLIKEKPDLGISSGSIPFSIVLKLLNVKNYQISDDPERKLSSKIELLTSTKKFYPPLGIKHSKVVIYNCLKQWAYLSPKYFKPNIQALDYYNIKPKQYIFIRDISNKSLNYLKQEDDLIIKLAEKLPNNYKVLLSLEDKSKRMNYPAEWILLEEPIIDIHSLMYYSMVVISSGDSVAREAGMLAVPAIYCGIRKMAANDILIKKGLLFHPPTNNELLKKIYEILNGQNDISYQEEKRNSLAKEWIDLTDFILDKIKEVDL